MTDFKLPASLRNHFLNLSLTIQQLVGEIILNVEGMADRDVRAENAMLEQSARAQRANELINDHLKAFLANHQLDSDDAAIAVATASGRSTSEIADFLGLERRHVMRRVCAVRKSAVKWKPEKPDFFNAPYESGEILELFAETAERFQASRKQMSREVHGPGKVPKT